MFERLKRLYIESRISQDGLESAVQKKWITQKELQLILKETPINK